MQPLLLASTRSCAVGLRQQVAREFVCLSASFGVLRDLLFKAATTDAGNSVQGSSKLVRLPDCPGTDCTDATSEGAEAATINRTATFTHL